MEYNTPPESISFLDTVFPRQALAVQSEHDSWITLKLGLDYQLALIYLLHKGE